MFAGSDGLAALTERQMAIKRQENTMMQNTFLFISCPPSVVFEDAECDIYHKNNCKYN